VEWYLAPSSGQLQGCNVSLRLRLPPSGLGQLRGHHVSLWLRLPPPSAGQLWECHVPPRLQRHLWAWGRSGGTTCPQGADALRPAQGSSGGGSSTHLPTPGSSGGAMCLRSSSAHLLA
jgi:hypothetical protein